MFQKIPKADQMGNFFSLPSEKKPYLNLPLVFRSFVPRYIGRLYRYKKVVNLAYKIFTTVL